MWMPKKDEAGRGARRHESGGESGDKGLGEQMKVQERKEKVKGKRRREEKKGGKGNTFVL